jgi:hypothetical protein
VEQCHELRAAAEGIRDGGAAVERQRRHELAADVGGEHARPVVVRAVELCQTPERKGVVGVAKAQGEIVRVAHVI